MCLEDGEEKTYHFYLEWSEEDEEWVGLCHEHPWLSHLDHDRDRALTGIMTLVFHHEGIFPVRNQDPIHIMGWTVERN